MGRQGETWCAHFGLRTPIWKGPGEYRDAVTLPPHTLYQVWLFNEQLVCATKNMKESSPSVIPSELKSFCEKHPLKIMTDWKKSGLTIPHWFIKALLTQLEKLYGYDVAKFPADGWDIWCRKDKRFYRGSGAGYGLGMVNHANTLWNIFLFRYAKELGIFSEEDEIMSFNDDSIIGCGQHSYFRWLKVCRESGGYLDTHKTFSSKGGVFCEVHHFPVVDNGKWVSHYNTLLNMLVKCVNNHHWRFQVSDIIEQTGALYSWPARPVGSGWNTQMSQDALDTYIDIAEKRWSMSFEDVRPEYGGLNYYDLHRTYYGLKDTLLHVFEGTNEEVQTRLCYIKAWKDVTDHPPVFRPWVKFPEGRTKKTFELLGQLGGLNNELSQMRDKAKNRFNLDTEWYNQRYWSRYAEELSKNMKETHFYDDFWVWAAGRKWPSMAIPPELVSESKPCPKIQYVPVMLVNSEKETLYSLQSMICKFVDHVNGTNLVPEMNLSEVDFSAKAKFEVIIHNDSNHYNPLLDITTISKMETFHSAYKCQMDYIERTHECIIGMKTKDFRGEEALEFLKKLYPDDCFKEYKLASWWTVNPLPIKEEWLGHLSGIPIKFHYEAILGLHEGSLNYNNPVQFDLDYLDRFTTLVSPNFWKSKTSKQKKSRKKATKLFKAIGETPQEEEEPLWQLNRQDLTELVNNIYLYKNFGKEEVKEEVVENTTPAYFKLAADSLVDLDLMDDEEDLTPDREVSPHEDEDDYINYLLDSPLGV